MIVTGTETRDGIYGEWVDVQCPKCGEHYMTYWRPAEGGAEETAADPPAEPAPAAPEEPAVPAAPAEPEPVVPENPAPAEPEAPAAPPQPSVPDAPGNGNGGQQDEPPVIVPAEPAAPSGQQPPETPVPVPQGNPDPAPAAPSGEDPRETAPEGGQGASPAGTPDGGLPAKRRRNTVKYPYFSGAYPSRRLDKEGEPDALAPIPGLRIYPESPAEGSSILQHMLDGN